MFVNLFSSSLVCNYDVQVHIATLIAPESIQICPLISVLREIQIYLISMRSSNPSNEVCDCHYSTKSSTIPLLVRPLSPANRVRFWALTLLIRIPLLADSWSSPPLWFLTPVLTLKLSALHSLWTSPTRTPHLLLRESYTAASQRNVRSYCAARRKVKPEVNNLYNRKNSKETW